jgi:hypothetical protein
MTCGHSEDQIALYAGGDMADRAEIERRLAVCSHCRRMLAAYSGDLAVLREAHREPIAPAHYAAVRARVLAKLEHGRRPLWRWTWVGAGAMAAGLAFLLVLRPSDAPDRPAIVDTPAVRQPPARIIAAAPVIERRRSALVRRRIRRTAAGPVASAEVRPEEPSRREPLMVKLLTDDPNVIIYWIADERGE